jgi:mono/diheme cytochrome c family protein
MRRTNFVCGCATLFVTVACCAGASGQSGTQDAKNDPRYAELAKAPEKYRTRQNPLNNDPEAAKAGGILFEEHCEECHGVAAIGGKKAPSLRAPEVQGASDGTVFWILSNGIVRKRMPVWSKLPDPQRWQLVSYIKSLGGAPEKSVGEKTQKAAQEHNQE